MSRRRLVPAVAATVVLTGGATAALVAAWVWGEPGRTPSPAATATATPTPTPEAAPTVLAAPSATSAPGAPPLAAVVGRALADPALRGRVAASVVDLRSGATVFGADPDDRRIPASALKILTAAAALHTIGPDHVFTTRVVAGSAGGEIVIVGGGDPTLTVDPKPGMYDATMLASLADRSAAALRASGISRVQLVVDDGLFTGPAVNPAWRPSYVSTGAVAPVTALEVDGGRLTPGFRRRAADPSIAAAESFARLLADRGVQVAGRPVRGEAPPGADEIAAVTSAPLARVVEQMLLVSDNDAAEVLARHVAWATGRPATVQDAAAAVVDVVQAVGVDLSGAVVLDGSGLARGNALSPSMITATLAAAADSNRPELRAVLTGLPVARFTGTLDERFDAPAAARGAGVVRAKTGTLDGVRTLAGTVVASDGTAYGFAVLADEIRNATAAAAALDHFAALLADCGCAPARAAA
ncbi:MAG: D-alanyl-D-alanine carboxypeptidase/D-alanyl-D-alanine-endopeptidase [Jiangellaceae bacterium]|nr:D-alanyl-D-alanine carboxypeptidase/D-alanyl-D-alanine-endopeptidase [Jiangellaceae bacterium]